MPADPTNLFVALSGKKALLTWDASGTGGVADYSVFRRSPSTRAAFDPAVDTAIAAGITTTSYVDAGLAVGTYDWEVFGRVPASTPPIAGYTAWYDASDTSSITASGVAVSQWNDKSGNGYHLTQGTGSNQPTTGTRTINSLNAIDFDGTADYLSNTSFAFNVNTMTWLAVFLSDAKNANNPRVTTFTTTSTTNDYDNTSSAIVMSHTNADAFETDYNSNSYTTAPTTGSAVQFTVKRNGAAWNHWKNGTAGGSMSSVTTNFNPGVLWVGATYAGGVGGWWDGLIAEIVMYPTALSDGDRVSVQDYLKAKWGTP